MKPVRRHGRRLCAIAALAAMLLGPGCVKLSQPAPAVRDYRLAYPVEPAERPVLPLVLQILSFTVSAAYDSQGMLFRDGEHRLGRFRHDRWAANPGNLIADALARDLAADGSFRAVQTSRAPLVSDYKLSGEIEEFEEHAEGGRCFANLRLRLLVASLRPGSGDPVALRRAYEESEPSICGDGASLAAAMSTVMDRISTRIRADVYDAIAAHAQL